MRTIEEIRNATSECENSFMYYYNESNTPGNGYYFQVLIDAQRLIGIDEAGGEYMDFNIRLDNNNEVYDCDAFAKVVAEKIKEMFPD